MKYFVAILLLIPIFCNADYSDECFFMTGRIYVANGKPLSNSEVLLVTGDRYFCFFITDKNGDYKVEVPYLVPCLSGFIGRTRFDNKAMKEAKEYNSDSIHFYCGGEYSSISNSWYKYYSQDTNCRKRDLAFHGPYHYQGCLTEKRDVHLVKKNDANNNQEKYRRKITNMVDKINELCFIPNDSISALSEAVIESGWLIPNLFSRYQLYGRNINCINDPKCLNLCSTYFTLKNGTAKNEYYISTGLNNDSHDIIFRTDNNGVIQDVYNKAAVD